MAVIVALVGAFTLAAVALVLWWTGRSSADRVVTGHLRQRYLVTLDSGQTFDGLLDDADERSVSLVAASSVSPDGTVKVDGVLILPRSDISYMQRP